MWGGACCRVVGALGMEYSNSNHLLFTKWRETILTFVRLGWLGLLIRFNLIYMLDPDLPCYEDVIAACRYNLFNNSSDVLDSGVNICFGADV
jgi:hypothetical protein